MSPPTLRRRAYLQLALACLAAAPLSATAAEPAVTAPIQQFYDALLGVMKAGTAVPFAQRFDRLAPTIDTVFDLDRILQASVGSEWNAIPAGQQSVLRAAFRRYTIASYISSFDNFTGQRFDVASQTRELPGKEQVVTTHIIPATGEQHRLDYVMRQSDGGWRVVDVLADGTISRVAVQRSDFRRQLVQGNSEALVVSLQAKAEELAGG